MTKKIFYPGIFIPAFLICLVQIASFDLPWHLQIGKILFESGNILHQNRFSWTHPELFWTPTYWLFEGIVYLLYSISGYTGLILFKALITGVTYSLLASYCSSAMNRTLCFFIFIAILDISVFRFLLRPHLFTLFGLAILIRFTYSLNDVGSPLKLFLKFFFLFLLWSNLHSGVLIGLAYLVIILFVPEKDFSFSMRNRIILFLVSLSACFMNPAGGGLFTYVYDHLNLDSIQMVEEFHPLQMTLHLKEGILVYSFILVPLILMLVQKKISLRYWTIAFLNIYLVNKGIRFIPEVSLLSLPGMVHAFSDPAYKGRIKAMTTHPVSFETLLGLLFAVYMHLYVFTLPQSYFKTGFGLHEGSFPIQASDHMNPEKIKRLYNSFSSGGYLIWKFNEKIKVFQDGRIHAYPFSFWKKISGAQEDETQWPALMKEYDFDSMLFNKSEDPPFMWQNLDKKKWEIVFEDDFFILAQRRRGAEKDKQDSSFHSK
ncbi:MAG: hypothetical protein JW774_10565 [Candidatus Aureabacteria bacterium]|nr:hypothetical protein [Candidatus Auribacterota bacterium]